jgi:hypothetical protein
MSDFNPFTEAGPRNLPAPSVWEPSDEGAPELDASGPVVLLLAAADHLAWAADAAVALGTAWARDGRRIVLADLHLENPVLHERVGVANLEGVADVFLYGASIARSARPVRGRGFYLISAGTYEPDAEAVYRHPRWPKLVAGFRDANASLILFAPAETADLEALARWVDDAVLLGTPRAPFDPGPLADAGVPVNARLVPPGEAPPPPPVEPDPEPDRTLVAPPPAAVASPRPRADRELQLPPPPERPAPRRRGRGWLVALVALAAMGALAWAGYLLAGDRVGPLLGGRAGVAGEGEVTAAAPPPPAAPTRLGEALPFSVQVKAFSSFPAAGQERTAQQERSPAVPFFVSPEEVQGVLYFKVMAGFATDTAAANALQTRLVETGAVDAEEATGTWSLIRPTPFAFDLGEFPTPEQAGVRADSLLAGEIPTYTVAMPYSDGSRRWQLYGGAYQDSASAEAMRQRLLAAGLQPRLVLRLGEPRAGGEAPVP